jgi:predicted dithiol-disulfide oxidoreductase (DUF899 family)
VYAKLTLFTPVNAVNRKERRMDRPQVVTREEWLTARLALLDEEKELTRARDALSAARRGLPMVRVETPYEFEGADGPVSLGELFEGRRQLVVYHFMFEPGWEEGCPSCSYLADNATGAIVHLEARDTSFAVVSRAPYADIDAFRRRMGWQFTWVSSFGTDFNYDYAVTLDESRDATTYNFADARPLREAGRLWMDELPGLSVFLRDGDEVFHTYSTYGRGLDTLLNTYNYLDLTPLGRHEDGLPWSMAWVRHHDRYGVDATPATA